MESSNLNQIDDNNAMINRFYLLKLKKARAPYTDDDNNVSNACKCEMPQMLRVIAAFHRFVKGSITNC
jgi:hypothetical protein